jgi:hypothetical protein
MGMRAIIALIGCMRIQEDNYGELNYYEEDNTGDIEFTALRSYLRFWVEFTGLFTTWPASKDRLIELLTGIAAMDADVKRALQRLMLEWTPQLVSCMMGTSAGIDMTLIEQLSSAGQVAEGDGQWVQHVGS